MKVEGSSAKANRFMGANSDLRISTDQGVLIRTIEIDNWLHVLIDVTENNTHDSLRDAIPLALQWRDRLLEWQGPWVRGGANSFYYFLNMQHERGISYSELAHRINSRIAESLYEDLEFQKEYQDFLKEAEAIRSDFDSYDDFFLWVLKRQNEFTNSPSALDNARDHLKLLNFEEELLESVLDSGVRRIQSGEEPFEKIENYPVDRKKMISVLRTWRSGKKHRARKKIEEELENQLNEDS